MSASAFARLTELAEGITRELIFAEAGTDLGLLPINSLLGKIEELIVEVPAAAALADAVRPARDWVEAVLATTGNFSAADLQRLGEWVTWWQTIVGACEAHQPLPPPPAGWDSGGTEHTPSASPAASACDVAELSLDLNLEQDGELLREFLNESQEHLQNIEQGVLILESNPSDLDTLSSIFRAFHTFKGCAGFLNLRPIQQLAHELESLLDLARQQKLAITPPLINLILEGGDTLKQFMGEIGARLAGGKPAQPIHIATDRLLETVRATVATAAKGAESPPAAALPEATDEPPVDQTKATRTWSESNAIKVDTVKLDSLVDQMGELVIAQSLVVQNPGIQNLQSEQLNRDLAQLGRISKDLQRTVMSLRMVPIRGTFQKMHRLVRDLAVHLDKQVTLATEGEDTELDRTIVEEISDPLIHMIRNAIDHGIEMPDERRALGKPAAGTLWLKAFHQGGSIIIEVRDDGCGLNRARILGKALQLGLVQPGDTLSDSEAFNLILTPGFSTAAKVTDVSGRGVGMDVVRRNIEKLRGKIEIQSVPGRGTSFSIYLPLTLAIIDGLLVGVGEQRYLLPTLLVRESFRPAGGAIHTVQGRGEMIEVRGRLRPLLRLYEHLGIQPDSVDPVQSIVMVVEAGSEIRCVLVDRVLGKQEVVIKSLGDTFRSNRCVAGAAILGDGRVGLILDPHALVQLGKAPMQAAA
jgi:two-component system, chemotaxis family, sensor kinase CheA